MKIVHLLKSFLVQSWDELTTSCQTRHNICPAATTPAAPIPTALYNNYWVHFTHYMHLLTALNSYCIYWLCTLCLQKESQLASLSIVYCASDWLHTLFNGSKLPCSFISQVELVSSVPKRLQSLLCKTEWKNFQEVKVVRESSWWDAFSDGMVVFRGSQPYNLRENIDKVLMVSSCALTHCTQ